MTASPIIEHLNVLEDILSRGVTCFVVPMLHELALECPEEAFDTGIVPAVAGAAHAGSDAALAKQPLVARGRILTTAIRMVQKPGLWVSVCQRHREGLLGQFHGQPRAHGPADHKA